MISGCAALIYEVIWLQLLRLVIGASAVSVGILLASFMGGMFLGSLASSRLIPRRSHPIRIYALLELGVGVIGLLLPWMIFLVRDVYLRHAGYGLPGILLRAGIAGLCLLPPTILIGATFPAVSRWFTATSGGLSSLGLLYAANLAGAVLGALLAGFYLLPSYDVMVATYAAAALNFIAAAAGLWIARRESYEPRRLESEAASPEGSGDGAVLVVIALSGMTALGAQVVWTRLLSLLFGGTAYTFAIILAVFLACLGIGSGIASALIGRGKDPRALLGWSQLLLIPALVYAAAMITQVIPFWAASPRRPIHVVHVTDLLRCAAAIMPAATLWGASFPLALAAFSRRSTDTGRAAAQVYAANTVGAIAGALGATFVGVPLWGSRITQQALLAFAGSAALLVHLFRGPRARRAAEGPAVVSAPGGASGRAKPVLASLIVMVMILAGAWILPGAPAAMLAYGRNLDKWKIFGSAPYLREGMVSTVVVQKRENDITYFHVSGKVEATTEPEDMRLQRMMGHIPALIHPNPRSVLIVGMGAGVTAGAFVVHPSVQRIVICEIEPSVFEAASRYFAEANHHVLQDPRVEVVFDDARHYLATTNETFDIIASDPIHPWVRGVAALFTQEHYQVMRRHLNPGGVVAQWVPFYETSEEAVKIELRTFMEAFPGGTLWSADASGVGTDAVLAGQVEPMRIDLLLAESRIRQNPRLARSLADVQIMMALTLFATYSGRGHDLEAWLADTQPNRDLSMKLEYEAGRSLNMQVSDKIFAAIKSRRRFPEDLFVAPPETLRILRGLIVR